MNMVLIILTASLLFASFLIGKNIGIEIGRNETESLIAFSTGENQQNIIYEITDKHNKLYENLGEKKYIEKILGFK